MLYIGSASAAESIGKGLHLIGLILRLALGLRNEVLLRSQLLELVAEGVILLKILGSEGVVVEGLLKITVGSWLLSNLKVVYCRLLKTVAVYGGYWLKVCCRFLCKRIRCCLKIVRRALKRSLNDRCVVSLSSERIYKTSCRHVVKCRKLRRCLNRSDVGLERTSLRGRKWLS